jgi:hypothetical protein
VPQDAAARGPGYAECLVKKSKANKAKVALDLSFRGTLSRASQNDAALEDLDIVLTCRV